MLNYNSKADISNLKVIYEDNHVISVFKPAGLLVQGDKSNEITLIDMVRKYLANKYNKTGNVFLGLVHRLDKPTCGIVLFGKTSKGAGRLSEQFRKHSIKKYYYAIVEGSLKKGEKKHLKDYLIRKETKTICTNKDNKGAQKAELIYEVVDNYKNFSLLNIQLISGRKHQIRAQVSNLGYPIVGDEKYGAKVAMENKNEIALMAKNIEFKHAITNEIISLSVNSPESWDLWEFNIN